MGSPAFIPTFSMADFAQAISAPYSSFRAYQSGVINSQGNLIKPESSIDPFEYFVIKMKKIFDEIPPTITKSRLSSYNSAFQLFSEEAKAFGIPFDQFVFFVEGYLTSKFLLTEDMGAGAAGGGGMATGTSPGDLGVPQEYKSVGQVSGYDKPLPSPMFQRGPVEMFDLEQNEFDTFKGAKGWKNLPDSATKRYLQRFQRRNPSGRMGIRTKRDNGESDLYWITYPAKNFMEQFGLENLDFLFEEASAEESGVIDAFTDTANDPEINVASLPNSREKAKKDRKGFVRPKPNPNATSADRFREDINELIRLHGEATNQKREAQAHEYGARIAFHAHNYHTLRDTPDVERYMDATHQQIISSASANDRGLKSGDILRVVKNDSGFDFETRDFKSKGANVAAGFPVAFLKDVLSKNPEKLTSWSQTTPGSRQSFVFPKIKVGDVENPEHAKSARERFESMRSAIETLEDPNLIQQREAIKGKTEGKSGKPMIMRHPETGRFHFVTPNQVIPYISQKGGQADRAFREAHQRHNILYRRDFSNPPKDSEMFEMKKDAQDTLLSHADPAHHELLKKLTDIHIKKT